VKPGIVTVAPPEDIVDIPIAIGEKEPIFSMTKAGCVLLLNAIINLLSQLRQQ
jgi:hypothetical protein